MPSASPSSVPPPPQSIFSTGRLAAALAVVALGAAVVIWKPQQSLQHAREWLTQLGPWAPVLFIILYVTACVLMIPASALTLAAGALFGVVRGSIVVSIAATLGATAAFLVSRYVARHWIEERLRRYPRLASAQAAVAVEGWKIVLLTRLSPAFPFAVLNYAFGLTRVPLRDYVLASWIGMLPGTILYVYLGSVSGAVLEAATGTRRPTTSAEWVLYGAGLVATIAATVSITRIARRALRESVHTP